MRRVFTPARGNSAIPSWAAQSTLNEWLTLPGDTRLTPVMTDVSPYDAAKINISSYSGACLHPTTGDFYVIGGGHADYAGNDVYRLTVMSEAPAWTKLRGPTPAAYFPNSSTPGTAYYAEEPDGKARPASRHTWWSLHIDAVREKLFMITAGAVWGTGNETFATVDTFDLTTNDYDPAGTWASAPFVQAGMLCVMDARGDVWISGSSGDATIAKWTRSSATWATQGTQQVYDRHGSFCYDSLRDRVVKLPETGVNGRHWPCSGAFSVTYFTMTGDITVSSSGTLVYEPVLDRYLLAPDSPGASVTLYSIHPTTWVATAYSTTGTAPITGGAGRGNMNRRICYHPQLGGLLVQPEADDYLHFLRTH